MKVDSDIVTGVIDPGACPSSVSYIGGSGGIRVASPAEEQSQLVMMPPYQVSVTVTTILSHSDVVLG